MFTIIKLFNKIGVLTTFFPFFSGPDIINEKSFLERKTLDNFLIKSSSVQNNYKTIG